MSYKQDLDLVDIVHRTGRQSPEDLLPLLKYLSYDADTKDLASRDTAADIASHMRRLGSNDFATFLYRGGEGVTHEEIVLDVAQKLKAPGASKANSVVRNEAVILEKMFGDALDAMSLDERRALFQSMNVDISDIPLGAASPILMQILLKQFGGFATYRFAVILANMVARALLGGGLSFAANMAITRSVGALLGPIGWIATGAWLAIDLAGPAFRKTVPAVLYVAMLRQSLLNRVSLGVVGAGSAGKDSLIQSVFKLSANIDPIAGSTEQAISYPLGSSGTAEVINYPGFDDYRPQVNRRTDEMLRHTDAFILVVDVNGGISGADQAMLTKIRAFKKPILVCLNKWDLVRDGKHDSLRKVAAKRLGDDVELLETAFDPDLRLRFAAKGREQVLAWVCDQLEALGKSSVAESLAQELR